MHPVLNIAIRAVRKGGNILIQNYDHQKINHEDQIKKQELTNKVIKMSEQSMINIIRKSYPEHIIFTKKYTHLVFKTSDVVWIINALDGISNFKKNLPHFCISIAIIIRNITEISVIYDPLRNELFTSVKGQGAQLNGYRMRCNSNRFLDNSLIGITISYKQSSFNDKITKIINMFLLRDVEIRSTGCINLDFSYIAIGRLDFLFNFNIHPLVVTAGSLQVKEAGGLISDFNGEANYVSSGSILVGNSKLMREILLKIRTCLK
ncbi:MAG: inositol monophosphatase family protein [Buchnera aphidicola (Schlechtendalia peitan)]